MVYPLQLILVFLGGALAGAAYFGGLMLTVRRARFARRPWLFFLASFSFRSSMALAVFLVLSGDAWERLLACLLGFLLARQAAVALAGPGMRQPQQEG